MITAYKWTIGRYHQAIAVGLFDDQPVELLRVDIIEPIWDLFNQLPIFEASGEQNKD